MVWGILSVSCLLDVRMAGAEEPVEIQVWRSKVRSELEIELGAMSIRWSLSARIHVIAWGEREEKEERRSNASNCPP